MPTVTTGANLTNRSLQFIAVSGDGDTAAIGISHFIHAIRRNLDMVYIIENNGVYGLTKGQYSPTVEKGSQKRKSPKNERPQIDLCAMAINLGCTFVARSFSGSKKQLTALMKAAMSHRGTAIIDVISPCVTFNNNDESFKSYGYVKDHQTELHAYDYIPKFKPITEVEVPEGEYRDITLFDGSTLRLETIGEEHDPSDAVAALSHIHHAEADHRHVTGLLYYDPTRKTLDEQKNLPDKPLSLMSDDEIRPSEKDLEDLLADFRA